MDLSVSRPPMRFFSPNNVQSIVHFCCFKNVINLSFLINTHPCIDRSNIEGSNATKSPCLSKNLASTCFCSRPIPSTIHFAGNLALIAPLVEQSVEEPLLKYSSSVTRIFVGKALPLASLVH